MANVSLFYNSSRKKVFLSFTHNSKNARHALPMVIEPNQWDGGKVINRPDKRSVNAYLQSTLSGAQLALLEANTTHRLKSMSAIEVRDIVCAKLFGEEKESITMTLEELFEIKFTDAADGTKTMASDTLKCVHLYTGKSTTPITDITEDWIYGFREHMQERGLSVNTRIMFVGKIRTSMKFARKKLKIPINDPFYGLDAERPSSKRRNLTLDELRLFFSAKFGKTGTAYQDVMKLIFTMRGINMKDLFYLRPEDIRDGRICYRRYKTHKEYNVKLEPEALAIIEKYKSDKKLLSMFDTRAGHKNKTCTIDMYVQKLCRSIGIPCISTYWMRHTWASIAFNNCNIPSDVISAALGHSYAHRVTMIYVDPSSRLVDEANRKVLDIVFGSRHKKGTA